MCATSIPRQTYDVKANLKSILIKSYILLFLYFGSSPFRNMFRGDCPSVIFYDIYHAKDDVNSTIVIIGLLRKSFVYLEFTIYQKKIGSPKLFFIVTSFFTATGIKYFNSFGANQDKIPMKSFTSFAIYWYEFEFSRHY